MTKFAKEILSLLLAKRFSEDQLQRILEDAEIPGYELTGSGYFLTINHPEIPNGKSTWSMPTVKGNADEIECGFLAFITDGQITLECHSWGELEVPEDFREREVRLTV